MNKNLYLLAAISFSKVPCQPSDAFKNLMQHKIRRKVYIVPSIFMWEYISILRISLPIYTNFIKKYSLFFITFCFQENH